MFEREEIYHQFVRQVPSGWDLMRCGCLYAEFCTGISPSLKKHGKPVKTSQGFHEFPNNYRVFVKFLTLGVTFLRFYWTVNLCSWLCKTSEYAQSFCFKNHSGHIIICGIVVVKIAHWSNFGFRLLMSSSVLIPAGHGVATACMIKETA